MVRNNLLNRIENHKLYWIVGMNKKPIKRSSTTLKFTPVLHKCLFLNERASEMPRKLPVTLLSHIRPSTINSRKVLRRLLEKKTQEKVGEGDLKPASEVKEREVETVEEEKRVTRPVVDEVAESRNEVVESNISDRSTVVEHYNQEISSQDLERISTDEEV
eukprot:TRINITY_DN13948_c0_g3_i1.p1 TRINITY_DN13948_c0_g3~~TRINITY_DN13948_c0_g3_i1.p1  ORF type:complete len:161 (-),score=35.87 TRINITY_DN13948_c0_g3_i1:64-546(-)